MKRLFRAFLAVLALSALTAALAADPSLNQVYEAMRSGHVSQAQGMISEVLRDHPNSGKAHYVQAEIYAKTGRFGDAEGELSRAEQLAPGLPFAAPSSVQELRGVIANGSNSRPVQPMVVPGALPVQAPPERSFPWGVVLVLLALGGIVFVILRARRNAQVIYAGGGGGAGPTPYYGGGQAMPYGAQPMAPMGGGGIGSGIVGGLVTGAALGAGMVAGEALAHDLMDGGHHGGGVVPQGGQPMLTDNNDMGGQNFGVADSGSWDDGGGGGGGGSDDWG